MGLGLRFPGFELTVKLVVLLVNLAFKLVVDFSLSLFVLTQDILEILGPTSISQSILIVGQFVLLDLVKFFDDSFPLHPVLFFNSCHFILQLFSQLLNHSVLLVSKVVVLLVKRLVHFVKFLVQFAPPVPALLQLPSQHFLLTVFVS